ncbi:MAG: family 10 glycosylhydrolase [Bacteroidia bacterium]
MRIYLTIILLTILLSCQPPAENRPAPTRGVWLTNVDSEAMFSRQGLEDAVDLCVKNGFNTIFAVTWNRSHTLYPSKIMEERFGVAIDPKLTGRDPLQELIEIAHAKGIKVFAWFEFGFSSSYQEDDGGMIIRKYPHWAAIDTSGNIVSKNGFQWMNGFDPKVQDFLLSLLKEVVENYEVDGIQGDDRLPALPSEAGYDSLTVSMYQAAHGGNLPPRNTLDTAWVSWRADKMNDFMQRIHAELKAADPEVIISMSPSIFPWSKEQYLQDWPKWVREGWIDMVCPQVYRYDIEKYRGELRKIVEEQVPPEKRSMVVPGILLKVGDYYASEEFLQEMIEENRKYGLEGEVFFFYEGLKRHPAYFEGLYQ